MPPPVLRDEADDLDDLDDVLDQFNAPPRPTHAPPPAAARPPRPPPAGPASTSTSTSFPDPDDASLPNLDDLDPSISADLEQAMKAMFAAMGGNSHPATKATDGTSDAGGVLEGLGGLDGESGFDHEEFKKAIEEFMQNGGAGLDGLEGQDGLGAGEGDAAELQQLMAALGMGGGGGPSASASNPSHPPSSGKGKDRATPSGLPTAGGGGGSAPPPPANFQDAIAASLSKMQSSSSNASAAAAQQSAGAGNLASMLAGLSGMPDLSQLGDAGSEEGLQGMLDEMMKQLMSREMLYEPLKELSEKYPAYLESARPTLPPADLTRYETQQRIVSSIVTLFEEPGADKPVEDMTAQEKDRNDDRTEEVVELVAKMNECGAPPKEIMGEMPPGMELGPDGVPKIPECTIC
ncbi:hypothetical protein JCM10212_002615 [Sporobolomyces blumeae]